MDQIKIGRFISLKRKEKKLTQQILAEKLGITDRAISKWENGICLPDASIMPDLCEILDISINDLFSGEMVDMKDNEKKLEENLITMTKLKEEKDKALLNLEIAVGLISIIILLTLILLAALIDMQVWLRILIIVIGFIVFVYGISNAIKLEQIAGYYECKNCHHKYVPTYRNVFFARHINRTRYMKCPKCNKKSWHKKVLS